MASRAAKTIDELLAQARATLPERPSPAEALRAQASGALLIDIREDDQRREDGLIPGAIVLPRNSLEWRCDPASEWRHPAITRRDLRIILICNQGYQSTLAAATLQQLGLIHATDLDGGFTAWAEAGLPVIAPAAAGHHPPGGRPPEGQLSRPWALCLPDRAASGPATVEAGQPPGQRDVRRILLFL
jgi:rhodanese-related sulfurtransferase